MPTATDFPPDFPALRIFDDKQQLGAAAAADGAALLRARLRRAGLARIIVASGNSQVETIAALTAAPYLDWSRIEVFHMDEYLGIAASHPASFRRWVAEHVAARVRPAAIHYLAGEAADPYAECTRYATLLARDPIDVCFLGIGENGHIAFNDPHEADFLDERAVRRVTLDEQCRRQQVGEGHFAALDQVPREALTLTCSMLVSALHMVCAVPDLRKAEAARAALRGPVTEACPASILRTHPHATVYLDRDSASLLGGG
jgi:glucosamine-6-phosphate deaminase